MVFGFGKKEVSHGGYVTEEDARRAAKEKPKTPLEQVESGLAKPYQPFVGVHPEVSLFDDVFAAGKIAYGETVGLFDPNAKKVAREGYATMNKVGAYYGAYPIEGVAEVGSEAAFVIATGLALYNLITKRLFGA